jgi:hypothetical protein
MSTSCTFRWRDPMPTAEAAAEYLAGYRDAHTDAPPRAE